MPRSISPMSPIELIEIHTRRGLRSFAGHTVTGHWSTQAHAKIGEPLDALVISLERLPSHGRAVADGFWAAKKRQCTPIVFVGGERSKVDATRKKFPRAVFCTHERLLDVLKKFDVETSAPAQGDD